MRGSRVYEVSGAGRWFPCDAAELREQVGRCMDEARVPSFSSRVIGGITPHAGYDWSGGVAGHTFRVLRDQAAAGLCPEAVVALGFSHRSGIAGVSVLDADAVQTPLGRVAVDVTLAQDIVDADPCIRFDRAGHVGEHSVGNAIPFIQAALPGVPVVPILMEQPGGAAVAALSEVLVRLGRKRPVVVLSSTDLLHDADYDRVVASDEDTLARMAALDLEGLRKAWSPMHQVCCGIGPVSVLMQLAQRDGAVCGHRLAYQNSGDLHPGSRGQWVVGYGALVFVNPN